MPTLQHPLGPISGNIEKRKELTPFQRGLILGTKLASQTEAEISKYFNIPDPTVCTTISCTVQYNEGQSRPRSGQPKCLSDREERTLIRYIQLYLKEEFLDIKQGTGL